MTRAEAVPFEALGVEGLVQALLERPGAVPGFVVARELADIPEPAEAFTREERAALSSALQGHLAAFSPHVAVLDSLRSLEQPRASVVIAGQQPGFLASPLYNVHKALHAVRLARTLSGAWGRPVVPMFWNHADDHDLAEVNHAFVANENLDLQKVALAGLSSGRQPYSRVVLQGEAQRLGAIRATLEELCRGEPQAREALDVLVPRAGESLASAFTRSMTELFGAFGLVVLEPDWIRPALSRSLAGLLARKSARGSAQSFEQALELGAAEVRALGHAPQIDPASAALLYRVDGDGRSALRAGGDGLRYDGESGSRTREELAAEIVQDPLAWSPAALTRAVAQDACLPVAAYVGGLGELAYHAQLGPLRDFAGVPRTPFVARFSCTLIEPEVAESLAKLELSAEHVLRRAGALETEPDASAPAVIAALREIAARAAREISAQREELAQLDAGLAANLKRTGEQMRSLVEKLCEKAERVHANRTGKGQRHARRVSNALMPRGLPQERVLGPLPFLARYGRSFLEELFERVPALPREHLLVRLGAPPKESP